LAHAGKLKGLNRLFVEILHDVSPLVVIFDALTDDTTGVHWRGIPLFGNICKRRSNRRRFMKMVWMFEIPCREAAYLNRHSTGQGYRPAG
jgi:hypothetical protein